jgi:hypothetical protein
LRPSLLVLFAAFAGHLAAQPANVQADPTTGALFRPAAATFISGNSLLTTSAAGAAYQPLDADLTSWAAVVRAGGFDTFVATPSSANLATLVTGETGSGALVFGTSPTFTTPTLGAATATSLTGATDLTLAGGTAGTNSVVVSNTLAASSAIIGAFKVGNGTAATNVAIGGGVIYAGSKISVNNSGLGGVRMGITSTTGGEIGVYVDSSATTGNNIGMASAPYGAGATSNTGFWANPGSGANNIGFLAGNLTPPAVTASFYGTSKIITTDSTPSTGVGTGALQVAGGIYAGAASYFGGSLGGANQRVATFANTGGNGFIEIGGSASKAAQILATGSGVMALYTNATAGTIGTLALTLSETQAAAFAGAVTIAGTVIHTLSATPASASAAGTVGTMSWDANYIYICTATNTWKRVAIATW